VSAEVIRRHTFGEPRYSGNPIIGIASISGVARSASSDHIRVIVGSVPRGLGSLKEYAGVLTDLDLETHEELGRVAAGVPAIHKAQHLEHISEGDVLRLDFKKGYVRSLYRVGSPHNSIFVTDRCNSNCLMCSQPPKDIDDSELIAEHLRLVSLIPPTTQTLGISGGEPTLLGNDLLQVISACKDALPVTRLHMLSNGRRFVDRSYAARLAHVAHPNLMVGIPLYSDVANHHDFVVQADGAFDQTMVGFHNLARYGIRIEVRIVVHKQTFERLPKLAEFIYRNLPFVEHIAFMGLEMMGYTKTNLKTLWIDPVDYQETLQAAVSGLAVRGMNVSIYNHQLCVLRRSLWRFARKSISDFKNIYLDACEQCAVVEECGGLFKSGEQIHSAHIHALAAGDLAFLPLRAAGLGEIEDLGREQRVPGAG
jgi:His-Xaa-Ser system radical SAM maturase HxsC